MDSQSEINALEVDRKQLRELEALGFPFSRAAKALHYSGNASIEDAVNWIIDHENDADIDQMPVVAVNIEIEASGPKYTTEEIKMKLQELRDWAHQKREEEEKKSEREREKERIRAGKELLEAKRTAEENERKRFLASRKAEKEEVKRAREKIRQKIEADKVERKRSLSILSENPAAVNPSTTVVQKKMNPLPLMSVTKAEHMRECLRSLRRNHKDDDARVKRAFQTLLIYVGNVIKNPNEEKFRRIRVGNPLFQDRVGSMTGGIEFLELCGFERIEGGNFLFLSSDKVDMAALNSAGSLLRSALTNPFFGVLSG